MPSRKASFTFPTPWVPHTAQLIESPAWCVMSLSERKVLDRIELEHMRHGCKENGKLPVTYDDFVKYGVSRKAIRPAIRTLVALGLIRITRPGKRGGTEARWPNLFVITYLPSKVGMTYVEPSNDWKGLKADAEATARAHAARKPEKRRPPISLAVMRARKRGPAAAIAETGAAQPCQLRPSVHEIAAPPTNQITASSSSSGVLRGVVQ